MASYKFTGELNISTDDIPQSRVQPTESYPLSQRAGFVGAGLRRPVGSRSAPFRLASPSVIQRHAVTTQSCSDCSYARFQVSVSPSRGAFHLSLTVPGAPSVTGYSGLMVVHPGSDRVSRARPYSGPGRRRPGLGSRTGLSPMRPASHAVPLWPDLRLGRQPPDARWVLQPRRAEISPGTPARRFGHRSLFACRYSGVSRLISSSGNLDVSSSPVVLPAMRSAGDMHTAVHGFAHSRPPGRRMCAPRRGLSQLAASFIGSLCQGIRRAPVVSCGTASGPRDIHVSLN